MWVVFVAWVALFFLVPTDFGSALYEDWVDATTGTLFGETGASLVFLIQTHRRINAYWSQKFDTLNFQGVSCCYTVAPLQLLFCLRCHIFLSLGKSNMNNCCKSM
jgi:hypothetical protein